LARPQAVIRRRREPETSNDLVEPRPNGRVGNPELGLDILDHAPVLDEDLKKPEVLGAEPGESIEREVPVDSGVARPAFEARNVQLIAADGALTGNGVQWGWIVSAAAVW